MSIESLEYNIHRYRKQIDEYDSQIADLQTSIKELETLESQYIGISREFQNRNEESIQKLVSMRNGNMTLRAVSSYMREMTRVLSGSQYEKAQEGLHESRRIIVRKVAELDNEIHRLQDRIEHCMGEIHSCYRAIDDIKTKEAAEVV